VSCMQSRKKDNLKMLYEVLNYAVMKKKMASLKLVLNLYL